MRALAGLMATAFILMSLSGCAKPAGVMDAPKYRIKFEKDETNVKIDYDIQVRPGGTVIIADFQAYVNGNALIKNISARGQHRINGTVFYRLSDASKDTSISFAITTNGAWKADGRDVLRGARRFDDVTFAN